MNQLDNQIVEMFKTVQKNNKPVKISGFTTYRFREDPQTLEEFNDFFVKNMQVSAPEENFQDMSDHCLIKTICAKNNRVEPISEAGNPKRPRRNPRSNNRRN